MVGDRRRLLANCCLALASTAFALGSAELVARSTQPAHTAAPADYITDWRSWDGDFYTVKSTAVGWPPWEDYNTEGLRDREHVIEKTPGTTRVACLGDSVTLGWGILPRQAWPQVLEEMAAASGRDLDILNIALGGWSTRQELIAYRRIARRYHPDQVLVGICLNDVAEMQNNLSRPPPWVAEAYRRSALVRAVVGAERREIGAVEELFTAPDSRKVHDGYARMFEDLRALRDETRGDGARFAILVFPFRFQVTDEAPPPLAQRTIADFGRREGIPVLDLLPALQRLREDAFHDYDHFSPLGARRVAEAVLDSGLVDEAERGTGHHPPAPADPGHGKDVPALIAALQDSSAVVRASAAWALGNVGPAATPAVEALDRLLGDDAGFVRAGAAFALGGIGPSARSATPSLVARLDDADERVRSRVGDALARIDLDPIAIEPLARLVRSAVSPGRGLAAEALGRIGPPARSAVADLIAAASDRRAEVRWRAVWALGRIGPAAASAVPVLREALADPDVRWRAAEALGGVGPGAAAAVPDLEALLSDPSSNVRWRATQALGAIGVRDAAPLLAHEVHDRAENVRLAAVDALMTVGAPEPVGEPAFVAALEDSDSRVRLHALRGLNHLGPLSADAQRAVAVARHDPDDSVRSQAERLYQHKAH